MRDRLSSNGSHCPPCQNRGRAPARPIRSGNQARSTHHARAWLGREESREGSLANEGKQPVQDALISRRRISLERGEMAGPSVLAERGTEKSTPSTTGSRWWWSTSCSISPGTGGIAYLHDRPPLVPHYTQSPITRSPITRGNNFRKVAPSRMTGSEQVNVGNNVPHYSR